MQNPQIPVVSSCGSVKDAGAISAIVSTQMPVVNSTPVDIVVLGSIRRAAPSCKLKLATPPWSSGSKHGHMELREQSVAGSNAEVTEVQIAKSFCDRSPFLPAPIERKRSFVSR